MAQHKRPKCLQGEFLTAPEVKRCTHVDPLYVASEGEARVWERPQLFGLGWRVSSRGLRSINLILRQTTLTFGAAALTKPIQAPLSPPAITLPHKQVCAAADLQLVGDIWHSNIGGGGYVLSLFRFGLHGGLSVGVAVSAYASLCLRQGALVYLICGSGHSWRQQIIVPK